MMKTTTHQYDIKHSGDEMERLELLSCLHKLGELVGDMAGVEIVSEKSDWVTVTVTEVDAP